MIRKWLEGGGKMGVKDGHPLFTRSAPLFFSFLPNFFEFFSKGEKTIEETL